MSKFFYDDPSNNQERGTTPQISKKNLRFGTKKAPAQITVQTEERKKEVQAIMEENKWVANILVDAEKEEDTG